MNWSSRNTSVRLDGSRVRAKGFDELRKMKGNGERIADCRACERESWCLEGVISKGKGLPRATKQRAS